MADKSQGGAARTIGGIMLLSAVAITVIAIVYSFL